MAETYPDPHAHLITTLQLSADESTFRMLFDAYAPVLFGVILRIIKDQKEAENLLQDCFVKIWKNVKLYDPDKGRVATWLINIARHTAIDFIRSPYYKQKVYLQPSNSTNYPNHQKIVDPIKIETLDVKHHVGKLSPDCREVLERMYFDGKTQQEISEILEIPLGTVKTRCRSAIKELRAIYTDI